MRLKDFLVSQTSLFTIVRYKEESDSAELDIVVEKEEGDLDERMLRSAKVNYDQDSNFQSLKFMREQIEQNWALSFFGL